MLLRIETATVKKELFPETIDLSPGDFTLVSANLASFNSMGMELEVFGPNSFKINGIPLGSEKIGAKNLLESCLEELKNFEQITSISGTEKLARSMSLSHCIKSGTALKNEEMQQLIEELFSCANPYLSPGGLPIIVNISLEELDQKFEK